MSENKIVVSFDLCSSSKILEDLSLTGNVDKMGNMLRDLHIIVDAEVGKLGGEVYKFTGDGWILIFPDTINGKLFVNLLTDICARCCNALKTVRTFLESTPQRIGIVIGMDRGPLLKIKLAGTDEWVGRAINVACRLQNAIKDKDDEPEYKALMSKQLYQKFKAEFGICSPGAATRKLRNIRGGENFECIKVTLFRPVSSALAASIRRRLLITRKTKPT